MRKLGELSISPIGLGTVKFGRNTNVKYPRPFPLPSLKDLKIFLETAKALGINYIDTAPAYGESEDRLGQLLGYERHDWIISTKVGEIYRGISNFDFSSDHTQLSIETSMKKLRTDYLDIVFVHCSDNDLHNLKCTDVIGAVRRMQEKGYVRYVGASTKTLAGGYYALDNTDIVMIPSEPNQIPILEKAWEKNIPSVIKKPLKGGFSNNIKASIKRALSYQSVVSVVVGSINKRHLKDNVKHATSF